MVAISHMANIQYVRQKETKGLGHAVLCAKAFVGNEPFAVLYGDDVIIGGERPACRELCEVYEQYGRDGELIFTLLRNAAETAFNPEIREIFEKKWKGI